MENRNKPKVLFICFIYSLIFCNSLNAKTAADPAKLKIIERILYVPPLEEIKNVISEALSKNFAEVSVEIVDSPDLKKSPFNLAASGLGGRATILDIGGPSLSFPEPERKKLYDIKTLVNHLGYKEEAFIIGPASGPCPYLNIKSDFTTNIFLNKTETTVNSYITYIDKIRGAAVLEPLPLNETRFSILANLFLSEGKPGKVIRIQVRNRTGNENFISSMRKGLANRYSKLVGLGGTFLLQKGTIKHHFPNFFEEPVRVPNSTLEIIDNFYLYNGSAPLIGVGTFVSAKTDLDLEEQHFHTFSHHGEGGHYRYDTTPETAEYLGYFSPGEILYRVDQPEKVL